MSTYTCAENAGVRNAAMIKDELLALLDKGEDLTIDFANVRRADLSVVQLVIAAQKEVKARNLSLRLSGLSPEVKRDFWMCGIIKNPGV